MADRINRSNVILFGIIEYKIGFHSSLLVPVVFNPVNGEKVSIWVSDYVLMGCGTGVIMAVAPRPARLRVRQTI